MTIDVVSTVTTEVKVGVVRVTLRARCAACGIRRVLYRLVIGNEIAVDTTEARCSRCWGMHE